MSAARAISAQRFFDQFFKLLPRQRYTRFALLKISRASIYRLRSRMRFASARRRACIGTSCEQFFHIAARKQALFTKHLGDEGNFRELLNSFHAEKSGEQIRPVCNDAVIAEKNRVVLIDERGK